MALDPKLISLAADPTVQSVARQVFGWLNERRAAPPAAAGAERPEAALHAMLRDMPTRADLATALAQIDVRIAQAERRVVRTVAATAMLATLVLGTLVVLF